MKIKVYYILLLVLLGISCQDEKQEREIEYVKDQNKKELIFQKVSKAWQFDSSPLSAESQATVSRWQEWRTFLSELKQKPQSSIGAFQQKSRTLARKANELNNNIPPKLDKRSVKSRIAVLTTQLRSLDLYIHLNNIPEKKVISLIPEINYGIASLQAEFEEIHRKDAIPMEQGESDLIQMRDTARAIPTKKPVPDLRNPNLLKRFEQRGIIQ